MGDSSTGGATGGSRAPGLALNTAAPAQKQRSGRRRPAAALLLATSLLCASLWTGCAIPVQRGRISLTEAPTLAEREAAVDIAQASCSPSFSWLYPGLGQLCYGATAEGATLASVATAEIAATTALFTTGNGDAAGYPLTMLQNTWVYAVADGYVHQNLARRRLYAPPEGLFDLMAAPFNLEVLAQPEIWVGLPLMIGAAVGVSFLAEQVDFGAARLRPAALGDLSGRDIAEGGLTGAAGVALFGHVAIGEEMLFRGALQSGLARGWGPWPGWAVGSLIFGAAHIPNAWAFDEGRDRARYLAISVPFITVLGSYIGLTYHYNDYSLAVPTALHFWYDLALFAGELVATGGGAGTLGWSTSF